MSIYISKKEGRKTYHLFTIKTEKDNYMYLDASYYLNGILKEDRENGYRDTGPLFAIEHNKIINYVEYVRNYINNSNFYDFATRNYNIINLKKPIS